MKAIMISIKPKWCAKIMNGEKTIEVRISKALANATQKLIDEYGYAEFYVYCTKGKDNLLELEFGKPKYKLESDCSYEDLEDSCDVLNGKVIFKFRCYKVEEIGMWNCSEYGTPTLMEESLCLYSCLNFFELKDYIKDKPAYAIHISDLEIFDKPKEIGEFMIPCDFKCPELGCCYCHKNTRLTKAPQNFCYVEVEK